MPIKVFVISSVIPEETSAGQLILHRHLAGRSEYTLEVYGEDTELSFPFSLLKRSLLRLSKTRLHRWANDARMLWSSRSIDHVLPRDVLPDGRTAVLTVAHGSLCFAAQRFARRHGLPLVTIFHDWWPDKVAIHDRLRPLIESRFRKLFRDSDLALCVSPGMLEELGEHTNAHVHFPIPQEHDVDKCRRSTQAFPPRLKIVFMGNLFDYGQMVGEALQQLKDHPFVRLEVRGSNPEWSEEFKREMLARGLWLPFTSRENLDQWLMTADAFLIPQVFCSTQSRQMRTNFPSKLLEYSRYGAPLVVWAPLLASASVWSDSGRRAKLVNSADPAALQQALEKLTCDPTERERLAFEACEAAESCFDPRRLHDRFTELVTDACLGRAT